MITELIKRGNSFSRYFTEDYDYGMGINSTSENEYFKWLSKVGVYVEYNFKKQSPEMTKQILEYVARRDPYVASYNVIMGYLEAVEEMNRPNKEIMDAINDFNN